MEHSSEQFSSFWQAVGAALAALARRTGCSLHDSPLPELREAARDWRGTPPAPSSRR
jgi:hypothetical protein